MIVFKWFCFAMIFLDVVSYIIDKVQDLRSVGSLLGLITGIFCRGFILYGTVTCWVLA